MNSFFARHPQREIPIREYTGKSPLFYPRMQMIGAVFTANLRAVRTL
jgi:hypothetical protein